MNGNKAEQFWCNGCGCERSVDDSVNTIKEGQGLCYRCNKDLEQELGQGVPEHKTAKSNIDNEFMW